MYSVDQPQFEFETRVWARGLSTVTTGLPAAVRAAPRRGAP